MSCDLCNCDLNQVQNLKNGKFAEVKKFIKSQASIIKEFCNIRDGISTLPDFTTEMIISYLLHYVQCESKMCLMYEIIVMCFDHYHYFLVC